MRNFDKKNSLVLCSYSHLHSVKIKIMILLTLVFIVMPRDFSWERHYLMTDLGLSIWENLQLNSQDRERILAGGDRTDKIVMFWDVTLIPQCSRLCLYKVQRSGIFWGGKGIQREGWWERGCEQEGEEKLRGDIEGFGKALSTATWQVCRSHSSCQHLEKVPAAAVHLSSCWEGGHKLISTSIFVLGIFFFLSPEAQ